MPHNISGIYGNETGKIDLKKLFTLRKESRKVVLLEQERLIYCSPGEKGDKKLFALRKFSGKVVPLEKEIEAENGTVRLKELYVKRIIVRQKELYAEKKSPFRVRVRGLPRDVFHKMNT